MNHCTKLYQQLSSRLWTNIICIIQPSPTLYCNILSGNQHRNTANTRRRPVQTRGGRAGRRRASCLHGFQPRPSGCGVTGLKTEPASSQKQSILPIWTPCSAREKVTAAPSATGRRPVVLSAQRLQCEHVCSLKIRPEIIRFLSGSGWESVTWILLSLLMNQLWLPAIIVLCLSMKCTAGRAARAGVRQTQWENQLIISGCERLKLWDEKKNKKIKTKKTVKWPHGGRGDKRSVNTLTVKHVEAVSQSSGSSAHSADTQLCFSLF